jgi:inosose dehydratase
MTRRKFIASLTAVGVAASFDRADSAAEAAPGPTFGFSTYGMKSLSTEKAIDAIAQIGYDALEISCLAGWDADPAALSAERRADLRKRIDGAGLRLTSLMENLPPQADDAKHAAALERLKGAAALAHELAPDRPPILETVVGGGKEWETARPLFLRRLPDWVKLAESADVTIAIKPHRMSALSRPEQATELLAALGSPPRLRVVYDYSHFAGRDMPMDRTIRALLPVTAFVALKDFAVDDKGHEGFKLPGETGQIDYPALIKQFCDAGYRGDFNCEVSSAISNKPGYDGVAAAKHCYQTVAPAFEKAGVKRAKR